MVGGWDVRKGSRKGTLPWLNAFGVRMRRVRGPSRPEGPGFALADRPRWFRVQPLTLPDL